MKLTTACYGLSLLIVLLAAGCVSLEVAAPPAASLGLSGSGNKLARMEKGRDIYITRCAKCHSVEPVKKYTPSEWGKIMPEMSMKTKLTSSEDAIVRAYISAVLGHGI